MKYHFNLPACFIFLFAFAFLPIKIFAGVNPDSTGLPGDHLDLPAVLEVFKNSNNLEDFEKKLNLKDSHINNLDLDGDGQVDYLRVVDNMKDNVHVIVLRDPVSQKESQDVAVIELEKKGDALAQLQIIGDEELYGENFIVEPSDEKKTDSLDGKWRGFAPQVFVVNVWYWPCVQYIYFPSYIIYVSPWYWMYWPYWWTPWPPYPYYIYYGWVYHYHEHYHYCDDYRMTEAHGYYGPRRVSSPTVHQRNKVAMENYKERKKLNAKNSTSPKPPTDKEQKNVPPKPVVKPEPIPESRKNVPAPTPPPPKPLPTPTPKGNIPPTPPPKPNVQPQPTPRPKGDVRPAPTPKPKGNVRPRLFNKKNR